MADYTYKERESEAAALEMRRSWLRDYASIPPTQDMALRAFTARTHGTSQIVGYHKAAFVFLMLRDALGTDRFDTGLRRFWSTQQFRRAGWSDLQHAFQEASGQSLDGFFGQWLERRGAPGVQVEAAEAQRDGARQVLQVTVSQAGDPYDIALPLALQTDGGTESRIVHLSQARETFALETAAVARAVQLDPQLRVFRRLDPRELPPILRQVTLDPATRVELALHGDQRESAMALARALLDHPPAGGALDSDAARLIIGTHDAVDQLLADAGLPARPASLAGRGSAQIWTAYSSAGRAVAVISARDAAALQALARPLPHYGGQSWLVFDGSKVLERGVWPAQVVSVPVTMR
jgi:hypothetical protein